MEEEGRGEANMAKKNGGKGWRKRTWIDLWKVLHRLFTPN